MAEDHYADRTGHLAGTTFLASYGGRFCRCALAGRGALAPTASLRAIGAKADYHIGRSALFAAVGLRWLGNEA